MDSCIPKEEEEDNNVRDMGDKNTSNVHDQ
jgi:hypothetical protein